MLVGRPHERSAISALLDRARGGTSAAAVLVGEAGIGKSTLLAHARDAAAPDVVVLEASGAEPERDLPFAALSQLLRPLLDRLDALPAVQADALAQALALRVNGGARSEGGPASGRFAVSAATLGLVSLAAEDQPLLLLVDDLHHVDRPSAEAIVFTARRLLTDAVAVLLAVRPSTEAEHLVAGLERVEVRGLTRAECAELVDGEELSQTQLDRLHEVSAGNPLAALAIARTPETLSGDLAAVPVPRLIEQASLARLAGLGTTARTVLDVVALAGDVDLATVARAAEALGSTLDALDEAERAGVIERRPDKVVFAHPLVRASVARAIDPAQRRRLHRTLAEVLPAGDLDRRARHLAAATVGPDEASARLLEAAADSAARRRAYAVAAHWGERAAYATADPDVRSRRLASAGERAWLGGLADHALELLGSAATGASSKAVRTQAQALRGVVSARCGSLVEARDVLLEATDPATVDDPELAVELLAEAVYTCVYLCDGRAMRTAVERLDVLGRRVGTARHRLLVDLGAGIGRVIIGEGEAGTAQIRRAVAEARPGVEGFAEDPRWRSWLLLAPIWLREAGDARALVDAVVTDARAQAAVGTLPFLLFHVARDDATTDRWASADAAYREAIALARESGQRTDEALARVGLVWLLARQGREDEVGDLIGPAEQLCVRSHLSFGRTWLRFAQGDLAAGLGHHGEAITRYREQQALIEHLGVADADLSCAPELVDCLLRMGDEVEATREGERFAVLATTKGQPWALARAHRALALCDQDPLERYEEALAVHERDPDTYERARTQLAYGAFLRRSRKRTRAREQLREALATFDRLTAAPWAAQASVELAATGERVQRRALGDAQPLTPQELQVARLLGDGRTTREAAAALFLSPKTVEYHLRHVYIKLAISSRTELAQRLADDPELRA